MFSTQLDSQFGCAWICGQIVGWLDVLLLYDGSCIENHNCLCAKYFLTAKDSLFMKLKPRRVLFVIRLYFQFHNSISHGLFCLFFIIFVWNNICIKNMKCTNIPNAAEMYFIFHLTKAKRTQGVWCKEERFFFKASKQTTEFSRHIKKLKVL